MVSSEVQLNEWLDRTRLIVCVGSGGVGKTTTAASIGLWAALRGRKVMVLTIDPAKRLANSLGLTEFGNAETRIDLSPIASASKPTPIASASKPTPIASASKPTPIASASKPTPIASASKPTPPVNAEGGGELWAMMLDSRSTWDNLINRVSPNDEVRDRILKNRVFRAMAGTFAGSQEYMATEKLYDLAQSQKYDLIVLDTPPVKNALDFLESPGRMISFLDEKVLGWFLSPYDRNTVFGSLMGGASSVFFRLLGAILGSDFLDDMTELMQDFKSLYDGFRKRHQETLALFRDSGTAFVTVCAPTESSVEVAEFFQDELSARDLPRAGVIVNQVHSCKATQHDAASVLGDTARELATDLDERTVQSVMARLGMAHKRLFELASAERALIERVLIAAKGGAFYQEIPRLDDDVNDLPGLREVGTHIFEVSAQAL